MAKAHAPELKKYMVRCDPAFATAAFLAYFAVPPLPCSVENALCVVHLCDTLSRKRAQLPFALPSVEVRCICIDYRCLWIRA